MHLIPFALIVTASCLPFAHAHAQSHVVVGISDGDTLKALDMNNREVTCRLFGIDAPEKHQAFGQVAKATLSSLTFNRKVSIEFFGSDRYRRQICKVKLEGLDINRELVARGMAWMYRRYTDDATYNSAEKAARARRLGVWADSRAIPPWEFRRGRASN